jgi:2-polyprenyl-3-methyl-5-hydroxy-6-metoxy-1,4-benzoquinol methylase
LPGSSAALLARAIQFHRQGRLDEAIDLYRTLLRRDPSIPEIHNNLGSALRSLGQLETAARHYRRTVTLRPKDFVGHANLGSVLVRMGRRDEGLEHLAAAYVLAPDNDGTRARLTANLAGSVPKRCGPRLREAWNVLSADPLVNLQYLVRPALAALKVRQPVRRALERLARDRRLDAGDVGAGLYEALSDPLAVALFRDTVLADHAVEAVLTALRRLWLDVVVAERPTPHLPPIGLLAAIALQAEATEWVYDETDEERHLLARLEERLGEPAQRWDDGGPTPALLVYALYKPLSGLSDDPQFASAEWTGPIGELIRRHVTEPPLEAALAASLPALTDISDAVSKKVRAQYETHAYPRWRRLPQRTPRPLREVVAETLDDPALGRSIDIEAPRILVAGCGTGRHALATANRFSNATVLAVDMSRVSLGYAARQAQVFEVRNISFAQADILGFAGRADRFDVIECSGVLHHMADPEAGWRVLRSLLGPRGLMRISLYSERGRAGIDQGWALIAEHALSATAEGIRAARRVIRALPTDAPARIFATSADFFSLSGCRDMFFHVHEDRFTLPRISRALRDLDLEFLGFELPDPRIRQAYFQRFQDDPTARDLDNWDRMEAEMPSLFAAMYQFWCRARS